MQQRFQIGDPVAVSSTFRYYGEWAEIPLWICGVEAMRDCGTVLYTVSEEWPPRKGETNGFAESDLSPRTPRADDDPAVRESIVQSVIDREDDGPTKEQQP